MVSESTVARYARIYRDRQRRLADARREAARQALDRLPAVAAMLRARFGAHHVGYFGSLTTGSLYESSDVDLYVDRIRRGRYFNAVDQAIIALGRPVDLIELERAPASLQAAIARDGVTLDG